MRRRRNKAQLRSSSIFSFLPSGSNASFSLSVANGVLYRYQRRRNNDRGLGLFSLHGRLAYQAAATCKFGYRVTPSNAFEDGVIRIQQRCFKPAASMGKKLLLVFFQLAGKVWLSLSLEKCVIEKYVWNYEIGSIQRIKFPIMVLFCVHRKKFM